MVEMAGPRYNPPGGYPNKDEQQIMESFRAAAAPLYREVESTFGPAKGPGTPRASWGGAKHAAYRIDRALNRELMQRYFSADFQRAHARITGQQGFNLEKHCEQERRTLRALREEPETVWSRLSDEEQQTSALQYGAAMTLLLVLGCAREFGRFGFDSSDPRKLRTGFFGRSRVDWATSTPGRQMPS